MLIAQQHLIGKAAALRLDHGDLSPPLADQIITGSFRCEGVIELNAVDVFRLHTVHQNHILLVDIQREARADN